MDTKIKRGQILKDLRIAKGLKQSDLAELLKITQQAYQRYEYGTSEPNADGFSILADFYGVTTDYLLGREVPIPEYLTKSELAFENAIIERYRQLPEKFRKSFLQGVMEAVEYYQEDLQEHQQIQRTSSDYIAEDTTVGAERARLAELEAEEQAQRKETG